jgi:TPR repeat protein
MKPRDVFRDFGLGLIVLGAAGWAVAADAQTPWTPFEASRATMVTPDLPATPELGGPPPDLAFGAYQRGYFMTALGEATKRLAKNPKDAAAMTLIGEIYRDGLAVRQDVAEAVRWYRLASGLGDEQAAFQLGVVLLDGAPDVPKDLAAAKAQFEKAAALGHPGALYNLGVLSIEGGESGSPDFATAADYFKRAALAGDDNGAYSYGVLLRQGRGVPLDIAESAHWLKRAADAGIIAGEVEYAIMLFNGVGVDRNESGAAKIFQKAAAHDNPIAQNRLAHLYLGGRGVPRDLVQAALWNSFSKAAGLVDSELDAATANLTAEQITRVRTLAQRQAQF